MTRSNELAEQMGVGAEDYDYAPPWDYEMAPPCRACGAPDCDEECPEFRAWLVVAWLEADAASGGDADAR
jgi:hypothetical protein